MWSERKERKRERRAHNEQQKRLAAGLPLLTEVELERLTDD
jgi:hypothetical protein